MDLNKKQFSRLGFMREKKWEFLEVKVKAHRVWELSQSRVKLQTSLSCHTILPFSNHVVRLDFRENVCLGRYLHRRVAYLQAPTCNMCHSLIRSLARPWICLQREDG